MEKLDITTSRTGDRKFAMGRVNVFLGANGTGKSTLLAEIRGRISQILPDHSMLNIEGGRAMDMVDTLELTAANFKQYRTFDHAIGQYKNKRSGTLRSRLFDALKSLELMAERSKIQHSDDVHSWQVEEESKPEGERSPMPRRLQDPMTKVFETFSDIFPTIELKYVPQSRHLRCKKKGNEYGPTSLSDGEKQVFSILADIVELADQKSVLFIDEPELNLNPALANRLWSSVESLLPEAIFFYATHSVSFANRDSVEVLIVLSDDNDNIQQIGEISSLSDADRQELLGNITQILSNKKSLIVEGEPSSFDTIFYSWLLNDRDLTPSPVGGCEDVIAIASRSGKWKEISQNMSLVGVVDRDYRSNEKLNSISNSNVIVLDYHEAESFFCHPSVAVLVASSLGTASPIPDENVIVDFILEFARENQLKVAARRAASRFDYRIGASIPNRTLANLGNKEQVKTLLKSDILSQTKRAQEETTDAKIGEAVDREYEAIGNAVDKSDIDELLRLLPGKELLAKIAPKCGCVDANAVARAARHHLNASAFPTLTALQAAIVMRLELGQPPAKDVGNCGDRFNGL
ncbi:MULTISPECIES: AAA family ATPase [unclassified Sphingopyxis]|uniref:AAA family ATPase n=1 Tax=unclassified Sphingopyxis TaxID=2614943 RepID=UPI0025D60069|nr:MULTISPECIES: AAA family ATPase [unclassified Sphingopyxis]